MWPRAPEPNHTDPNHPTHDKQHHHELIKAEDAQKCDSIHSVRWLSFIMLERELSLLESFDIAGISSIFSCRNAEQKEGMEKLKVHCFLCHMLDECCVFFTGSRTRSTGGPGARPQSSINIPSSGAYSSQESGNSTPEENGGERERSTGTPRLLIGSLPAHLSPHLFAGFKCPVCSKFISSDEMDLHLVMCLTKPRVTYNEDVLTKDAGECAICLEELVQGDTIARLPCLCIYHKGLLVVRSASSRKRTAM
ncbi:E3 ubiquitin- ligase ZNRF2-like protein [Labeo rohita]|uniref:RING-type E3 ubiquitin transferase n=1 Tax=Labeo rohita TaxID=84645 RepID=A0A498LF26_LABRO|nr:E3 ubiquitin- ligase ZNRF2-like protein [Labeo rohita]RXN27521.1 E3 ubiquitin- ligase ZNRF2-like protein [Labeo rohita]